MSKYVNKNVSNLPAWVEDNEQHVNSLTVEGAVQEVNDDEFFSGDGGASQVFTLSKKPIVVQVWEDVASTLVLKVPGVDSSTSGSFDYNIDKENKTITPTSNWVPAGGSNNVKISYTNAIPVPVEVEDSTSIAKYRKKIGTKFFDDIQTVADAEQRGNAWLAKYSEPFATATLKVRGLVDFEAGQKVRVVDVINGEDRFVLISTIKKSYPHSGDELRVGDKIWRLADWGKFSLERIRRLEEKNARDSDLLISIKNLPHSVCFSRRYCKVLLPTITGDGFILGHPTLGVLGTSKLGSPFGAESTWQFKRLVWPMMTYKETFYDDDFKDAGSTTANWDNTNKRLSIS